MTLHDRIRDLENARRELHDAAHEPAPDRDDIERLAGRVAEIAAGIGGGEYRPAYNGWRNRETWNAHLWITNEPGPYEVAREIVARALAEPSPYPDWTPEEQRTLSLSGAADQLREWYDETYSPTRPGQVVDAWTYAVAVVDWNRIAEALAE